MKKTLGVVSLLASSIALAAPSNDDLQKQIDELRAQLEATANAVETNVSSGSSVSIGGYGEMHYNNVQGKDEDEIDFHRFVLFIGKELNSTTRFFSEFEVEHALAGEGKPGEVEIEQAFIEKDINDTLSAKAGLFLVPVGILNETHEPDTFYGVERNNVEKNIIPATWWEGGVALTGKTETITYDVAVHSGLNITAANPLPRKGRQKVAEAAANDFAVTARVNYKPMAGVSFGATIQYQEDVTQGLANVDGQLLEAHAVVEQGDFAVRALYAQWTFDDKIAAVVDGAEKQSGFYLEPAYKVSKDLGVFARYSSYDNKAGNSADTAVNETTAGVNYWLADTVVLKADYNQKDDTSVSGTTDTFNLGVGYSF